MAQQWMWAVAVALGLTTGAFGNDWIVDTAHEAASDENPGTREAPLKTIGAAALKVEPGDRVLVRPGLYREAVSIGISGVPDAPITFESEVPHAAIVSGSDPAPAELWTESEPGVWRTAWPVPMRFNRHGNGEWVYADDLPLLRVDTPEELMPGFFWLDFEENAVTIMLLEGRTPADTSLELASRDGLFRAANWRNSQRLVEDAPWVTDIVIRGFTVVNNADWFRGFAAIRLTGERWLVENNHVRWGTRMGIQTISTRDCVVRGNLVEWAGVTCVGGSGNLNLRFEDNTVRYGNFRRNNPGAEGGGSKFLGTLDSVFTGNLFVENYGSGLWFDGGNDSNMIRANRSTDNFVFGGFFSEIGWHDIYDGNVSAYNEVGFLIGESPGSVIHRNIVCGNSQFGIRMRSMNRRAGMSPQRLADRRASLAARIPNIPEARLDQSYYNALKYLAVTPRRLSNNSAIMENLVFDNAIAYIEYRLYGDPDSLRAPFVQNFSEHNLFWARDEGQTLFAGPGGTVYPDGLASWQAASNRDLQSVVADPLDPRTDLPEWVQGHPFLKEPRLRLNTDLVAAGLNIVKSPETARLYARLRRATTLTPIELPSTALRACRFTLDNEDWVALWSTEDRGRRYLTLRVDVPEVVVEDAYGLQRTLATPDGRMELDLDYRPLFLRAFSGKFEVIDTLVWDVRRFNAIGAEVPVRLELFNDGSEPTTFHADMRASSGFRADPAVWEATIPAGERITLEGTLVPDGTTVGTLARVRMTGSFGDMPFVRAAQFAIGEGSGTIPYATQPIRVDGKTDDWGDLAQRVPLFELANFERDGFGDADTWSGPDDLSATFHAAWTEEGLYWLALVRDDSPLGCPEGVMAYAGDAIELFFDGRSPEMQWDSNPGEGTIQLIVTPAVGGRPSATYRRPEQLQAEFATGPYEGGYLIEGFIPFDAELFPAGEWREGRTVKLAVHVLDRDDPESYGTGGGRKALGWGITRATVTDRRTGEERQVVRTHASTEGWKTLILTVE